MLSDRFIQTDQKLEIVNPVGEREIQIAIHDVDETHSLIRQWPPVMSLTLNYAIHCGLDETFDAPENIEELALKVGAQALPETDMFCVESAGMATFVQMAFGILRALELDNVPRQISQALIDSDREDIKQALARIWAGEEGYLIRSVWLQKFIDNLTPRLFKLYVKILNISCRDKNLAAAKKDPVAWQVPSSMRFLKHLKAKGVRNFFVTGVVVEPIGGMREEVEALGYDIGPERLVEELVGCSSWTQSTPKEKVIELLLARLGVKPDCVLVIGDGIAEIRSGVKLGCVSMSRLDEEAQRRREIHRKIGTTYIVPDFSADVLYKLI